MTSIWGSLVIFILCPLLGGLPIIEWLTYIFTGQKLSQLGTGNVSVSAAFYHGGTFVGILAALSEAGKGIIAILLARYFFPVQPIWELMALIALIMGRYWMGKGAGTTNLFWGMMAHDWQATFLTALIGGGSFTIFRDRSTGRLVALFLLAFILTLRHPNDSGYIAMAWSLSGLMAWIFAKIPDDLDLPETGVKTSSRKMFKFFRGEKAIVSLNHQLDATKVGQKAATLSYLKGLGYQVPDGWIFLPGDDPQLLIDYLDPSPIHPLVVRSSAIGEDSETASAAGQYLTILNVTNQAELQAALLDCLASYNHPHAVKYRRDQGQSDQGMAVLIQNQVKGVFSGVAFSRDPVNPLSNFVVIEALPGEANQVVSGKITPEQYQVEVYHNNETDAIKINNLESQDTRDVPPQLIEKVAILARDLEALYHGIPQDIEWSYDGQQLWLLQTRTITNLRPIWTRKIASEVIPGVIHPLTWSINKPLTCGVWGDIFTLVLGKKTQDLDFNETATLHYQRAYFNATLLGEIFQRMGLPPESLEFLTRGAKMSKPSLISTLISLPGLLRLLGKERKLEKDFEKDNKSLFKPHLDKLYNQSLSDLSPQDLLKRIESILLLLKSATYYSILAPLSLALRQNLLKVPPETLDNKGTPEIASLQALEKLAFQTKALINGRIIDNCDALFEELNHHPQGQKIVREFNDILAKYGYLSDVATDIAVPCWQDNPQNVKLLFTQLVLKDKPVEINNKKITKNWNNKQVQKRLNLKGKVTEIYSQLLAQLRWTFLSLADFLIKQGIISQTQDIFYLTYDEIFKIISHQNVALESKISAKIQQRKAEFSQNQNLVTIPYIVYGNITPTLNQFEPSLSIINQQIKGIGASFGQAEGWIKICRNFQTLAEIPPNTIIVVPYADSGWGPLLARASGIIAEVGGSLSHGAIVAREYGIPAIMDVHHATELLRDGQRVRIDGQQGIIELLES
ncbi:glycerol-3-phosphate acyltransferase [Crocosphaera sp. XPORK-15E]|uniref:glycerol-3-phosphate acyltransferase n=1 Tax=Crocosphaera sp. XPORK-15E TaxID=3110247 RepID=UPI002B1E9867|nr:glycerol-3-phosphate acyltransferase [Crocosphaera sp. XPORK-15E]MEA5535408.1 glycerol-3-phosphate acyltransferase [Crocosphaera sp. XPORK-15E]